MQASKDQEIYSVICDSIEREGSTNWIRHNDALIEAFTACEDETAKEMIDSGFCRVEVPGETDGGETLWAEITELELAGHSFDGREVCL